TGGSATTAHLASLVRGAAARDVGDLVAALTAKSMVTQEYAHGTMRIRVLELIRQFAAERLAADDTLERALVTEHARWCADLVAESGPNLLGVDAGAWLDRLDAERDNIRVALERTGSRPLLDQIVHIASWWTTRGHWSDGRRMLERVLQLGVSDPARRADVLAHYASLALR